MNGFWALFLAFGLTLTALLLRTAHGWRFGNTLSRQLITDYGAPLMVTQPPVLEARVCSAGWSCSHADEHRRAQVLVWSALSYALRGAPAGVPRRVAIPNTWQDTGSWSVARVCAAARHPANRW